MLMMIGGRFPTVEETGTVFRQGLSVVFWLLIKAF